VRLRIAEAKGVFAFFHFKEFKNYSYRGLLLAGGFGNGRLHCSIHGRSTAYFILIHVQVKRSKQSQVPSVPSVLLASLTHQSSPGTGQTLASTRFIPSGQSPALAKSLHALCHREPWLETAYCLCPSMFAPPSMVPGPLCDH
jgi:hypothetical protein